MSLVLDPATEARIHAELATGRYAAPDELLAHALDLIEAERRVSARRAAFNADLEESIAQGERGEVFDETQLRARMAARRSAQQLTHTT